MKIKLGLVGTLILALAACSGTAGSGDTSGSGSSSGSGGSSGGSTGTGTPAVTAVGAKIGGFMPAHATIGAAGGTLTSPDGQLTLTVPAGALSADTTISIAPIENTAPGGVGFGYRFGPDGTTFAQPVTLTFKPQYGQLDGATPTYDNVALAFQNGDGTWQEVTTLHANPANHQLTATTTHFTDYGFLLLLSLGANPSALLTGQATTLSVYEVVALTGPFAGIQLSGQVAVKDTGNPEWRLNDTVGVGPGPDGQLDPLANGAAYTAPSQKPMHNPEAVSVRYTASTGQSVTLVNNIYVLAHQYNLEVTLKESGECHGTVVFNAFDETVHDAMGISLDDNLKVVAGVAEPGGPPDVTGVSACIASYSSSFDPSNEPIAFQLSDASGAWDNANHRLRVVASGPAKIFPVINVTNPQGNMTMVNTEGLGVWNAPGRAFYLDGTLDTDDQSLDASTADYTGEIATSLTPTQF